MTAMDTAVPAWDRGAIVTGMNVGPKCIWDADWKGAAAISLELHPRWKELNNLPLSPLADREHHLRS